MCEAAQITFSPERLLPAKNIRSFKRFRVTSPTPLPLRKGSALMEASPNSLMVRVARTRGQAGLAGIGRTCPPFR